MKYELVAQVLNDELKVMMGNIIVNNIMKNAEFKFAVKIPEEVFKTISHMATVVENSDTTYLFLVFNKKNIRRIGEYCVVYIKLLSYELVQDLNSNRDKVCVLCKYLSKTKTTVPLLRLEWKYVDNDCPNVFKHLIKII